MPSQPEHSASNSKNDLRPVRILQTTISVALLLATLFVAFSPRLFYGGWNAILNTLIGGHTETGAAVPTATNTARIGIVSGHWGNSNDPGAVCPDGTNEKDVNLTIASLVRQKLEARGYLIDLLQEFDARLDGYHATVLISIHADTCDVIDDTATGFKVAASSFSRDQNLASRLTACLDDWYAKETHLPLHSGGVTTDMTNYHAFTAIDPTTTAAIIETGFLNLDRDILVNHPGVVSDGIVAGILCFINNESITSAQVPTP